MKKVLPALILSLMLSLFFIPAIVQADNGPHGGFFSDTDSCAVCHRLRTASGAGQGLTSLNPQALCLACHGGSGANTNVIDGVYLGTGVESTAEGEQLGSLMGGGFTNALMATTHTGNAAFNSENNATSMATTSMHKLGSSQTLWGAGANNSATSNLTLECISCHDPHGSAGWDLTTNPGTATRVASYRLLRWQPSGSNGFTPPDHLVNWSGGVFPGNLQPDAQTGWLVPDNYNGREWYTIGTDARSAIGAYSNLGNTTSTYQPEGFNYIPAAANMAYFCAQCHDRYFNNNKLISRTDESLFCGTPGDPKKVGSALLPTVRANANGLNSIDPVNCLPVFDGTGNLTAWADARSSGDTNYMYRHNSGDDLRNSSDGTVAASGDPVLFGRSCVACHVSHGTTANPDGVPTDSLVIGSEPGSGSLAGGSVLLRMDGRTICMNCHAGDVGLTVGPLAEKSHNNYPVLEGSQCARCHSIHSARQ